MVMGAPGSGKTTLCEYLSKQTGWILLSPSKMIKEEIGLKTLLGCYLENNWNHESQTSVLLNMLNRNISLYSEHTSFIIDGHPRNEFEAKNVGEISQFRPLLVLDIITSLEQSKKIAKKRKRENETEESINIRYSTYEKENEKIITILKEYNIYVPFIQRFQERPEIPLDFSTARIIPPIDLFREVEPIESACIIELLIQSIPTKRNWKHFPGRHAVTLTKDNIHYLTQHPYVVSVKANGDRRFLILFNHHIYAIDRALNVYYIQPAIPGTKFFLLDAEYIEKCSTYIIIDILFHNDFNLLAYDLNIRLTKLEEICLELNNNKIKIVPQKYHMITSIRQIDFDDYPYDNDGYIFTPTAVAYKEGSDFLLLKWKPDTFNTADFLYKDGDLYTKDKNKLIYFDHLYMKRPDWLENNMVVECTYDISKRQWLIYKHRTDKTEANQDYIARQIFNSILHPISLGDLVTVAIRVPSFEIKGHFSTIPPSKKQVKFRV